MSAEVKEEDSEVLDAGEVYLLMKKEYRLSRNIRASWFFGHLNNIIKVTSEEKLKNSREELEVLSIIPKRKSSTTDQKCRYRLVPSSHVTFLARCYRQVYILDLSPSMLCVDILSGQVSYEEIITCLKNCLLGLTKPFTVAGSNLVLKPQIYITIIAYTPIIAAHAQQVLVQGYSVTQDNVKSLLQDIQSQLDLFENCIYQASVEAQSSQINECGQQLTGGMFDDIIEKPSIREKLDLMISPEIGLVNIIRYGMLGLQLLPENTSAGIIVITDGVTGLPDMLLQDSLLSQLRQSTIACSFIHVGRGYHPHSCFGAVPHTEILQTIATATFGAYLARCPDLENDSSLEMNLYHKALFSWNFQKGLDGVKIDYIKGRQHEIISSADMTVASESIRPSFVLDKQGICAIPLMRKKHDDYNLHTPIFNVLSVRLREGYTIKEVALTKGGSQLEVKLALPWRHNVRIEYLAVSPWPCSASKTRNTHIEVTIEGCYEFLHDMTCTMKSPFKSVYRTLVVKKFWNTLQSLSQTDQMLVHLMSFAANSDYYTIPDGIKKGVPLFYRPPNAGAPVLVEQHGSIKESGLHQFASYWKPIILMDINIWQRWLHTHRIGLILVHDTPLPKHLHFPNTNGRFHSLMCRMALSELNTLLREWSTFVLMENHSYVKLLFSDEKGPPTSFYILRVTSKPPCMVLRLAFLGGTPAHERNQIVGAMKEKLLDLTLPQRANQPSVKTEAKKKSSGTVVGTTSRPPLQRSISEKPCVVLLNKPVEDILVRYEKMPMDFSTLHVREPENTLSVSQSRRNKAVATLFNTLSKYMYHQRWIWSAHTGTSVQISMQAISKVLSTLTKVRLAEGFNFAHCNSGIISFVTELQMKVQNENNSDGVEKSETESCDEDISVVDEEYRCVLQYILFPPHTTTSRDSFSADEAAEAEVDTVEADGELEIITECWVEPQNGLVFNSPEEREYFDRLSYREVAKAVFPVDEDIISTLLTYEQLLLMSNNLDMASPVLCRRSPTPTHEMSQHIECNEITVHKINFQFDIMKLLPRCQQVEMLFSTFSEDVSTDQEVNSENCESANCILFLLLHEKQRCLNQREIILTDTECCEFPKLVLQRQRNGENPPFSINEENTPVLQQQTMEPALSGSQVLSLLPSQERVADLSDSQQTTSSAQDTSQSDQLRPHLTTSSSPPRWSCYIRHVGSSRLLITIMPASYKDLKKIMKSSAAMETMSEDAAKENNKDEKKVLQMESTKVEEMKCDKNPADSKRHQSGSSDSYPRPVYRRGRSVDASRRASQPNNGGYGNSNALTLPVYVYECIYSSLTSQLVNKAKESNKLEDVFQDQRFQNMEFNSWENDELSEGNKIKERTTSGGSGKFFKDQRPASIIGQNLELNWHCNTLVDAYQQCFATGLYKSLCTEQYVDSVDVQLVVDQLCEESWLEIDVTDFLQAVCGHINNFSKKVNQEEHAMESFQRTARLKNQRDHDTEDKSPVSSIEDVGKDINADIKNQSSAAKKPMCRFRLTELKNSRVCETYEGLHNFIQKKFNLLWGQYFKPVPSNPDIYYYMTSKAETNLSEEEDDEDDEDNIFVDGGLDSSAASDQLNKEMADSRQNSDKDLVAQIQFLDDEATTAINSDSRTLLNLNQSTKKVSVSLEDKRSDVTSESSHVLYDEMSINSSLESIDGSHIQDIPPLFVNLSCSVKEGVNVRSQSVRSLPTCLGELIDCLEDPVSDIDLSGLSITLDIICLTLPVDSDSEPCRKRSERTISVGSMPSPVGTPPQEADIYQHLQSDGSESASVYPLGSLSMDPLSILPAAQNKVVKDAAEQIKWLMKDEIASAKRLISPINATTLDMVAIHVTGSTAKATCKAEKVPLHFVFGAEHSRDKFIEEFGRMDKTCFENLELIGFSIMKEDNYYYLIRDESLYMFTPTTRLLQDAAVALSRENLLNHDLELSSMNLVSTELGLDQSQNSTEFSLDQSQNSTELGLDQSQSSSEIKPLRINEMDNPKRTTEELAKNDRESVINIKNENEIGTDIAKKEVCMLEMTEQIDKESNTETNYINPVEDNSSETSIQVLSEECGGDLAHEPELQEEDTSNAQEKDETHCEQNDNKLKENPVDSELNALRDKLHSDSANDVIKSSNTTAEVSEMSGEQEFSESEVVLIPPSSIPSRLQEEIMHPGTPAGTNLPASPSVTSTISSEVGVEAPDSLTSSGGSKHHRRQPSVFSTVSSGLTSVNASRVSLNDDEKAYDGGSSDNDSDGRLMSLTDTEQFQSRMPEFWLIMKIHDVKVDVFFHTRDSGDSDKLETLLKVYENVKKAIHITCKMVNQMMLLQDLNDTRICNPLLVAESDEDAWKQDNFLTLPGGMPRSKSDLEDLVDSYQANKGYLMDTMKFSPGHFACECKWQTHIAVHPRLKSGTTRMGPSRGIQAVRTILHQLNLAVSNRKNMFVYKETKGNNVFYLRLYESDNTSVYPAHVPLSPKSDSVSKASSLMSLVPDDQLSVNGSRRPSVRDSGLDTISVTSRTSSLSKEVCESIKIDVHGITETSSEISKDLVEVLKNRLDESTLDVIAMMMERNPLCKLASADVQFIQPRGEAPTTCIYFIVPQYWSSQMYAIGYYLRQNLQQFLHHPKYLDGNPENHFQAFSMKEKRHTDQEIPEKHVFIYHRPHSDGGKGLACIGLSMIDGVENTVNIISSPRPMVETQSDPITSSQFELYTSVDQYFPEPSQDRKAPGPTALIQLCIWERGNVDIPQLTNKLQLAMRYSLCDVIMEYKVLTTTLGYTESYSLGPSRAMSPTISPICTEISKGIGSSPDSLKQTLDPGSIKSGDTSLSTSPVNITYKRHGISMADVFSPVGTSEKPYFFRQQRSKSATPLSEQFSPPFLRKWIQPLKRSSSIAAPEGSMQKLLDAQMSCKSSRRPLYDPAAFQDSPKVSPAHSRSMSPMTISKSPKGKVEDISNVQEIEGQHQRRLLERIKYHQELAEGLRGVLHPIYRDTCVELLDWAYKLGVPSLHKMKASLTSRFSVDIAINEFLSLIRSVSSDVTLKVFQEMGDGFFYPIELSKLVFPYSEDKSESSFSSPLATSSTSLPSQPGSTKKYIVIGRNMHQWRCTVDTGLPGDEIPNYPSLINQDTHKSFQRFDPLDPGLSTCGGEDERKLVVPRQRLLHMQVNDKTITLYTYNWSSELNGTLDKLGNRLFQWHNARSHLLQCIVNQKLGLFQHRNFGDLEDNKGKEMNPYCRSSDDIDKLVKRTAPPMREHSRRGPSSTMRSAPSHHIQPGVPVFDEILRDQVPVITMQRCSYGGIKDPVMRHGSQFMQIYAREKEEAERRLKLENLYLMWQQRGAHSNMAISDDSLEILKQSSRLVHYCATPLLFSPLWRQQVLINGSSTPARVLSSTSLYKQNVLEEPWHNELRLSFVQHYIQYLQNLGFVQVNTRPQSPKRSPRLSRRTQMRGGSAGGSTSSLDVKRLPEQSRLHLLSQSTKTLGPSYYLQKAVPGGIMLMELTFQDCHFLVKLHALEASRLPAGRAVNPQLSVLFTQECDKFKDLVHVHSFTYDFHLRYIQSYLTTRHCILKPSYHVTSFLSDFVRYYSPGPNFSRNHVCEGVMNFRSKHTAADILFEYMLKNCPTYGMKAMKMNKNMTDMESMDDTDYIMVAMTPRGGIFEDSDGIKHQDEFDISIIISLDKDQNTQPPQSEQQIISQVNTSSAYQSEAEKKKNMVLKYYVILTSRRDLFPKLTLTKQLGKLRSMDIPPKETTHGHLLILTQARTVRDKINIIVNQVEMHCRRDMLWERLLIQDAVDEDPKRKKKKGLESKEAAKPKRLSFIEFKELLGSVHSKSLTGIDSQLAPLLTMSNSWYESLMRVLKTKYPSTSRLYASEDGLVNYLCVLNQHYSDMMMLLAVDNQSKRTDFCAVYKEAIEEEGCIHVPDSPNKILLACHEHVEYVVNTACYHMWASML